MVEEIEAEKYPERRKNFKPSGERARDRKTFKKKKLF